MENINDLQQRVLKDVRSKATDLEVRWNNDRGTASLLEGRLMPRERTEMALEAADYKDLLKGVLAEHGALIGPEDVIQNHRITEARPTIKKGEYRIQAYQVFKDMPVYGATLLAFADQKRGIYRLQSGFWREVNVTAEKKLEEKDIPKILLERLRSHPDADNIEKSLGSQKEVDSWSQNNFPLLTRPKLYLYPVAKGFHPAYIFWAIQPLEWVGVDGRSTKEIGRVEMMMDAATGEVLWQEPAREGMAYVDVAADGLSTLQNANGYLIRNLQAVKDDNGNFLMINRMHIPQIITHNAGGTKFDIEAKLQKNMAISQDPNGHWSNTTTSCSKTDRDKAQQPEVDGHFYAEEAWNFYHNLGWDGFDNGNWGVHCPVHVVTHIGMDANAYFDRFASPRYLGFYDGLCNGNQIVFDFMAGDPLIFAHEYQHAITFFGSQKGNGDPGYLYGNDWLGAIREGLSDSFACLRTSLWINPAFWPSGVMHSGNPFRRIEFPRSTDTYDGSWYCDHYDDRDGTKDKYFHSTLISHLAFLVGQGGIHQRTSRSPDMIPVTGIGLQQAAKIFLYALTQYFDTIPVNLEGPTLIEAGKLLLDAAKAVSGSDRSCEYVMMRRALYALGLYPYDGNYSKQTYGGEACMMHWMFSYQLSQPYLGLPPLWWQSPDLFINNGKGVEYDAMVGKENLLFARVRNIGDQTLGKVRVRFYFCPMGTNLPTSIAGWHTCKNQAGADCILDITSLQAGGMNITNVNNPPANQAVNWYLDPAYVTPDVNHFCLKAVIECSAPNNDNDCSNEVQSNISYVKGDSAEKFKLGFHVQNFHEATIPLKIKVVRTLPRGFSLRYKGRTPLKRMVLKENEPKVARWRLGLPVDKLSRLEPPFDGKVVAKLEGGVAGRMEGQLSKAKLISRLPKPSSQEQVVRLEGMLAGSIETRRERVSLNGRFQGELNLKSAEIHGIFKADASSSKGKFMPGLELNMRGILEPLRAVHFTQLVDGKPVGGVTVHIQMQRMDNQLNPNDIV